MNYARTSRNEIEMGEAEKYGAIAVRWTQDAQVIIITRMKLFEVEKKYIQHQLPHRQVVTFDILF